MSTKVHLVSMCERICPENIHGCNEAGHIEGGVTEEDAKDDQSEILYQAQKGAAERRRLL